MKRKLESAFGAGSEIMGWTISMFEQPKKAGARIKGESRMADRLDVGLAHGVTSLAIAGGLEAAPAFSGSSRS